MISKKKAEKTKRQRVEYDSRQLGAKGFKSEPICPYIQKKNQETAKDRESSFSLSFALSFALSLALLSCSLSLARSLIHSMDHYAHPFPYENERGKMRIDT
jgi:hypothetical protein